MRKRIKDNRGMALVLALICSVVVLGAVMVVGRLVTSSHFNTELVTGMRLAEEAAKSGVDFAVEQLWNQYLLDNGGEAGNLRSYKIFINELVKRNETVALVSGEHPLVLNAASGSRVEAVSVSRTDTPAGVNLIVQSTGLQGEHRCQVEQSLRVSGGLFNGFEFAVLANYINCILCHASFYNIQERYNKDPDLYGTFDRVKVATLVALLYRTSSADSVNAGTIYTRGQVYNEAYQPISDGTIESSDLRHFRIDEDTGQIRQNADGSLLRAGLQQADVDDEGHLEQYASLYTNYPIDPEEMTDGFLPEVFPAPYPDDNGNRYIEDSEFSEVVDLLSGSVNSGIAYGVPAGGTYGSNSLPAASNEALSALSSTGVYNGNLILVGTDANPIHIDGEVAVNGDLVLAGKVTGWGQILVRGNTYITGDVTYKDGGTEFGVGADGTRNGLALITGGSVLMGDYLTVRGKNHSQDTAKFPNTADSINVRVNESTVTRTINSKTETLDRGYFSVGAIDAGEVATYAYDANGNRVKRQGQQFSFTQSELQLFNNLELQKALADPEYRPRFYGLRDSQPNNIYVYTKVSEEHAVRYDEQGGNVKLLSARLTQLGVDPASILNRASFHYMNPTDNWISEDILRQFWWNDEMKRPANSPWKFDGLLYSNNAIFAITRSKVRHNSNTNGFMQVRGAIICPDIGVLVAGSDTRGSESFKLLYDPRVNEFWSPQDTTETAFQRLTYRIISG